MSVWRSGMCAWFLAVGGCKVDVEAPPMGARDALRAELLQQLEQAAEEGFSGAVRVTVAGEVLLAEGYGLADRAQDVPNTPDTAFDFGSVMKDLTAAAIFQLAGADELRVDDPLQDFFADVPADKADITLLQLLQHRAGLHEFHDSDGDFEPMTRDEALERIFAQPLLFAPGSEEAYSNSGYTLLAAVVEAVTEQAFTAYVRDALLRPAGMGASGFFGEARWRRIDTAIGYDAEVHEDNDPAGWAYTCALVGNGGLVTTPIDLDRWFSALAQRRVLEDAAFAAYEREYLAKAAVVVEGLTIHGYAGAGDYGLGGVAFDCPERETRVIIGTNAYEAFAIEDFAVELLMRALDTPSR